ncbi:MAG: hypothetical protein N3B16_11635 [Candidatus Aminicenantes bacterium]|nr:hypothetical protein [Candidatus Aminicenantes bacterium]
MNEVEYLRQVDLRTLPQLRPMLLDDLHTKVWQNLHLEVGLGQTLFMLSPSYSILQPTSNEVVADFVQKNEPLLDYLKELIIKSLAIYSALIDVNSYFIEQNNYLVLARLRERNSGGRIYEIKFYTHSPSELLTRYQDKIYIGRDFINLFNFRRKYFGLKDLILSLAEQYDRLLDRAQERLKNPIEYKSYFQEIQESINELKSEALEILQNLPPYIDFNKIPEEELININSQYRRINHYLIELHDEVSEFENLLRFCQEVEFVRYVTKYKKDITNLISYFNIKINGCLTQRIHQARLKEK